MSDDDATRVLLVEDDPNIVDLIRSNLVVRGFAVDVVHHRRATRMRRSSATRAPTSCCST